MSHVSITGSQGFLGWHTRLALQEQNKQVHAFRVGEAFEVDQAANTLNNASRAIHLAGINRAENDDLVKEGNILFAEQFASALRKATVPPPVVVFANSTQAENDSPYGESKREAANIISQVAQERGLSFIDLKLPNLFGEHGVPFYNAVTSTFCHLLAAGERPEVQQDKEVTLLHAQNAADLLTGSRLPEEQALLEEQETVSGLLARLAVFSATYSAGEIPDVSSPFMRDLFNTYRSYTIERNTPISLTRHADARGSFFEIIRTHGGTGQSSFSTTAPGISRGDHFHRRKIERFTVLSGKATISLRKMFTDRVFDFEVTGDKPLAIDMPTGWSHKITNTGDSELFTSFWSNDIFDPHAPDTIAEAV